MNKLLPIIIRKYKMYNKFYNASRESEQIESYSKDLSNISKSSHYTYNDEGIVGTAIDAVKGAWNGLKNNWSDLKNSVKNEFEIAKNNRASKELESLDKRRNELQNNINNQPGNNAGNNVTNNNNQQNANTHQANTNIQNNTQKKMND